VWLGASLLMHTRAPLRRALVSASSTLSVRGAMASQLGSRMPKLFWLPLLAPPRVRNVARGSDRVESLWRPRPGQHPPPPPPYPSPPSALLTAALAEAGRLDGKVEGLESALSARLSELDADLRAALATEVREVICPPFRSGRCSNL
jgi:hypothetical protein